MLSENKFSGIPVEILLAEDNPGDVRLTREALNNGKIANKLHVVGDGVEALNFLRKEGSYKDVPAPDLILMDLNMPRMGGQELLAAIKDDEVLRTIPIVVLTTSEAERDVRTAYERHANCYITKPVDLVQFMSVVRAIESFWFSIAKLPKQH